MIRTIFLLVFGATLLAMAIYRFRRQELKERYALLFALTGVPFLILAAWPNGVVYLSNVLMIEKPTIITLSVTVFVILVLFQLLSIVSIQDRRIATLSQMVAILMSNQKLSVDEDARLRGRTPGLTQPRTPSPSPPDPP